MEEKINIKSDEITEILGTPPKWIVRWGITVLLIIVLFIFIGSAFFRYPDIIVAPVVITAENPPSVVVARVNGKPEKLFVSNDQDVIKGDTLGVIENPAHYKDVFRIAQYAIGFRIDSSSIAKPPVGNLTLGELQTNYNAFIRSLADWELFHSQKYHQLKIEALKTELSQQQNYSKGLQRHYELMVLDTELAHRQLQRDSFLFSKGAVAPLEYERAQTVLLGKQQALEGAQLGITNNNITIERIRQTIVDTQLEYESQSQRLSKELASAHTQLLSALSSWEKSYLLIASSTGRLTYMNIWSDLQEVTAGLPLFAITPNSIGEVQARLVVPFAGAGKVKTGQRVNVKLDGYSYMEFGMVEGFIRSVSSGYTEQGYPAVAGLPNGTTTSYGVAIQFDRELQGVAEITTEDLSLLQRLFSPLKYLYTSRTNTGRN